MSVQPNPDLHTPVSSVHRNWFPIIVLVLGAAALLMFITTEWIRGRFVLGVEQVRAIDQIQTKVAISHLWVEEFVTSDIVDLNEIRQNLEQSKELLNSIERQAPTSRWLLDLGEQASVGDTVARAKLEFAQFADISKQRLDGFERNEDVGIGSAIDTQFDSVFAKLLANLRTLGQIYEFALARNESRSRLLVRAIIIAWLLIVGLAVEGLWYRERRYREAEVALHASEARLLQAQKMDAVGRLAGGIAHDINNHLAAITMQCELIKLRASEEDPIIERMDVIANIGAKSAGLIRRLLAFSRRQPVQPEVINLHRIVTGMQNMVARLIGEDICLQVYCCDGLWNVLMDPVQLEQILLNLILNARDAMPAGGEIKVSIDNRSVNDLSDSQTKTRLGDYVVLRITDQGTGISAAVVDKIYEPFFTTKDATSGRGLGLATVYGIVEQNRGYIELYTEEGIGTTFEILLPRSEHAETTATRQPVTRAQQGIDSCRILLIEDNEELRESTCEILKQMGYMVSSANNGDNALVIFDKIGTAINLVITDVVMPGIGGKELANRLHDRRPELPIIFVSGYTDDVILQHGLEAGEVNFLPKPFTANSLVKMVESVLARTKRSRSDS
ncbi:MAG: response regulator [Gammaproteobacteria bacterium]|nr:response regulator [Gammaproteobacteria bacterium]